MILLVLIVHFVLTETKHINETQQLLQVNDVNINSNGDISDNFFKKALSDSKYLRRQMKCVLGELPCDLVGRRLKSMIPIILRGGCPQIAGYQCTQTEVAQIKQAVLQVQMRFPREFRKLVQQYSG